ncbi:MAG: 2-C-methyl-D-erythritol 4-phosphate cytidylyltransferase [Lachnospiraceae bacterium]|nr:2-C-methyl-D-erythritol 4-phosphate cytidylyltransferase [Lachnospiraceae bacterium]
MLKTVVNMGKKKAEADKSLRTAAVVLAAGSGKRMGSSTKKQYMLVDGKPIIYYALKTFQDSFIDEIVLVASPEDIDFCRKEIVEEYGFNKVSRVVEGGRERYHSVAAGLRSIAGCDYIFIHDGARPVITEEILDRVFADVKEYQACVVGMPVKDTIKIADEKGNIATTPRRDLVWTVQTPQVFAYSLIKNAYDELLEREQELLAAGTAITDDAMVVESLTGHLVRLTKGSYENIKITTPEDIQIAESFLKKAKSCC